MAPWTVRMRRSLVLVAVTVAAPVVAGALVAGADGAAGAVAGAVFGLLLTLRAGWRGALRLAPLLVVAVAVAALLDGSWWWVLWVGLLAAVTGLAASRGTVGPFALVGAAAVAAHPSDPSGVPALVGTTALACLYAVAVGRWAGAPETTTRPSASPLPPVVLASLCGAGGVVLAGAAVAWGAGHAYWLPLTGFVLLVPQEQGAIGRALRVRTAGTGVGALVGGLALLAPGSAWHAPAAVLALTAALTWTHRPLVQHTLVTVALVLALAPAGRGWDLGGERLIAVVGAAVVVAAGATILSVRRPVTALVEDEHRRGAAG